MTNIQIRFQTKMLASIHRDAPDAPYSRDNLKNILDTFWTNPEPNVQQDQQSKCIYPTSGCAHALQPDWAIGHWHRGWGLAGFIPYVTNSNQTLTPRPRTSRIHSLCYQHLFPWLHLLAIPRILPTAKNYYMNHKDHIPDIKDISPYHTSLVSFL